MERKYTAFISYRHAELDSAVAKTLHSLIEQYRIPKALRRNGEKKFGIVFRDQEELSATNDLTEKIYTALDNSEHLIVICTKATLKSPWVTKEVEHFLTNHDRSRVHIILADGEPMEVFPHPLTHIEHGGGAVTVVEPMAVDVRADSIPSVKKAVRREKLRLFAAMLGCPYDALAMREQRRVRQRFAAVMALILAVAVSFSTVLLVKNHQIDQKNQELDRTNSQLEAKNEELDQKNTELQQQKEEVQLRESQLLTGDSVNYLKSGDRYSAIYSAVTALPSYEEERPYFPEAEAALLSALNPFGETPGCLRSTALEQSTPVYDFRISKDGARLATIDPYSVVTVFDTVTGDTLGTVQLNTNTVYMSTDTTRLLSYEENNTVIAFDGTAVSAVSFDTCQVVWSHPSTDAAEGYIVQSKDGSTLAYACINYGAESEDYKIVFLSAETGEVIQTVTFAVGAGFYVSDLPDATFNCVSSADTLNGCFSSDGTLFATSYLTKNEDGSYTIHYVLIDIAAGTASELCTKKVSEYSSYEDVYGIFFTDEDSSLIYVRESSDGSIAMAAEKIDIKNKRILWSVDIPSGEGAYYFANSAPVNGLFTDESLYLIRGDKLYLIKADTGELVSSSTLVGSVTDIHIMKDGFFAYTTEDGYYSAGWLTDNGLYDAGTLEEIYFSLGGVSLMRVYNDGNIYVETNESGGISAIVVGNEDDGMGYIAIVPSDNNHSVVINRTFFFNDTLPTEYTGFNEGDGYMSHGGVHPLPDGTVAIGPFYSGNLSDDEYVYKIVSPDTDEIQGEIATTEFFSPEDVLVLSDGSGFIECDIFGNITLFEKNGAATVLSEADYVLFEAGSSSYYDIASASSSAVQSNGDVLTAVCRDNKLTLWTNGKDMRTLPVPEDVIWLQSNSYGIYKLLNVGSNGCVILSDFDDDDFYVDRFAIYNTSSGTWSFIENESIRFSDGTVCFAKNEQKLIISDETGTNYMYTTEGELLYTFPLQLPYNSVYQADFILDDAYLMIKTTDSQLVIFDSATGEIVYRESTSAGTGIKFYPYVDEENHRLYIATDSSSSFISGLCIDLTSWTKLCDIPGLICYNADTNEMYRIAYDNTLYRSVIVSQELPPTKELVKIVKDKMGV